MTRLAQQKSGKTYKEVLIANYSLPLESLKKPETAATAVHHNVEGLKINAQAESQPRTLKRPQPVTSSLTSSC